MLEISQMCAALNVVLEIIKTTDMFQLTGSTHLPWVPTLELQQQVFPLMSCYSLAIHSLFIFLVRKSLICIECKLKRTADYSILHMQYATGNLNYGIEICC